MPIVILILFAVSCLPSSGSAAFDPSVLDRIGRTYSPVQKGLESYRADVRSKKIEEVLDQMTAAMSGTPRPKVPILRKYWSATAEASLIRVEQKDPPPVVREAARRFSRRFVIELRSLFMPPEAASMRHRLIDSATVKSFETRLEDSRTLSVKIEFAAAVDLRQAFYENSLGLPQTDVTTLALDIDPDRSLLHRLEISTVEVPKLVVELRHEPIGDGYLPNEIIITTPDGRIDERLETIFHDFDGYWLPAYQTRSFARPGYRETGTVRYRRYRINDPLPADVARQLGLPGNGKP